MEIKRGDIFYVNQGEKPAVGSEQHSGRPAIIVSNDKNNMFSSTVEVVYLTAQPKTDLPTHVSIRSCSKASIAICEQITTVSKERLGGYKGHVTDTEMSNLEIAMLVSLALCLSETDKEIPAEIEENIAEVDTSENYIARLEKHVEESDIKCDMFQQMYESLLDRLIAAR